MLRAGRRLPSAFLPGSLCRGAVRSGPRRNSRAKSTCGNRRTILAAPCTVLRRDQAGSGKDTCRIAHAVTQMYLPLRPNQPRSAFGGKGQPPAHRSTSTPTASARPDAGRSRIPRLNCWKRAFGWYRNRRHGFCDGRNSRPQGPTGKTGRPDGSLSGSALPSSRVPCGNSGREALP